MRKLLHSTALCTTMKIPDVWKAIKHDGTVTVPKGKKIIVQGGYYMVME